MVVRLYGTCQGQPIEFTRTDAGRWETAVPASPTGSYIFELWAEDAAGNTGYFATVRLTYDPNDLCFRFEILDVGTAFTWEDVAQTLCMDGLQANLDTEPLAWTASGDPFQAEVTRWEVCPT